MFRTRVLSSARARFAATAATVFALVALGGVTAAPASALANPYLYVIDSSTGIAFDTGPTVGDDTIGVHLIGGGDYSYQGDASNGSGMSNLPDGDYYITVPGGQHTASNIFHLDSSSGAVAAYVDLFQYSGTVPADAGAMAVTLEMLISGAFYPTAYENISAASGGAFQFRVSHGPNTYRLHFYPTAGTDYLETVTDSFVIDGSIDVLDLGAIALTPAPSIAGTVYAADGTTPIVGATVYASQGGTDIAFGTTDGAGAYRIPLPSGDGDYTVTATGTGFFAEEWDATVAGAEIVSLNATDGYIRTGINFTLDVEVVPISGTVLNWGQMGNTILAQLYTGGTTTPVLIEEVEVTRPGGAYSFASVPTSGSYFVKFVPSGTDAFLDTLLGANDYTEWSSSAAADAAFSTGHPFSVSFADPTTYEDLDVTMEQGVLFYGYFDGGAGAPIDGCVDVIDLDDAGYSNCVAPTADEQWSVRVPVGHTYKFHAVDNTGEYVEKWWGGAVTELAATEVEASYAGETHNIYFGLAISPASLYGFVRDISDTDPITVFLYVYANGEWTEVASHATAGSDEVYFDENWFNGYPGLAVGDYRVRFQDSDGMWLGANSHQVGRMPDDVGGTPLTDVTCYLDINDVVQGRPFFIDATFDAANQDPAACGPQPLDHRKVSGSVVTTPAWGSVPVAGHQVFFYNDDASASGTTAANGSFTVNYVPEGTFDVEVLPTAHVLGSHEYSYSGTGFVFNAGNVTLASPFEASRLGNAYGTISNWDSSMDGATATLYHLVDDPAGDYWEPGTVQQPVSATGYFEVPGIDVDGEYAVRIDFPSDYAPVFLNGGYPTPTTSFAGVAEQDFELIAPTLSLNDMVTISGTAFFGSNALEYGFVVAHPIGSVCSCEIFGAYVDVDGNYSFEVPPNADYEIGVQSPYQGILDQSYNGHNYSWDHPGPFAFDPITVGSADMAGPDFSLVTSDEVFLDISTYTADDYDYMAGVDIHIYKYVVDGWEEVATVTSDVDAWAYLENQDGGDYRFRFSLGGDWLAVNEVFGETSFPYEDDVDVSEVFGAPQCAVDVDDIAPGTYVEVGFALIEDTTVGNCGPEVAVEHYEVFGTTVQSDVFNNDPVVGQTVTLTSGTGTVLTETTDSQGLYVFEGISPGTYTLTVPTVVLGNGRAYVSHSETVVVDDDEALTPIKLTRYGNAEVGIYNWDASMAGAIAHLEIEGPAGVWTPIGISDVVDAGQFVIPGFSVDGDYRIWIDYPAGFVDGYALDWYDPSVVAVLQGDGEYDLGGTAVRAFTTVSGLVRLGAVPVQGATVSFSMSMGGYAFTTQTAADGTYTLQVPAGQNSLGSNYTVTAVKSGLVRGIITTQYVGFGPQAGVDLEMKYATFFVETFAGTDTLTFHLYRKVAGGWQEVESETWTEVMLWSTLSGDYRLRISDGADWLAISEYEIDGAQAITPVPNVCFIDIAPAVGGSEYELLIEPVTPPTGVTCGAEPAVVAPPVTPGTTGSGTKKPVATFTDAATTDEDVEPTSTPTPSPTASEDAADEPTDGADEADVDKPAAASSPDFTWLFWAAGILVLLVLAGGAVFIVRRRP